MSEYPMDAFDDRLVRLMSAYGDRAVTQYDAAAIAHDAVVPRRAPWLRLAFVSRPRAGLAIAAVVLVLLALAIALVAGSRRPSPIGDSFAAPTAMAWSLDGSSLAFLVDVADAAGRHVSSTGRPSHRELWMVGADGGAPRHLATFGSMATVESPIWTPDGRSIVVETTATADGRGHSAVISVSLDGSAPRTLLDAGLDPIAIRGLSPAGDRLLYSRSKGIATDLYVLEVASRTSRRLTTSGTVCCSGSWSPDGRWVMYTDGVSDGTQTPDDSATRVVAADGSSQRRLGPCCDVGWSADGRAYFQWAGTGSGDAGPLYSAAEDGSDVRAVPESSGPIWVASPDGSTFAAETPQGLEILRPGSAPRRLTSDQWDGDVTWSPDGAWVAYTAIRSGVTGVYVMPANGGEPRLVASDALELGAWRPGRGHAELTLLSDRAIVTADPEGGPVRDLVARTMIAGDPVGGAADAGSPSTIVIGPSGPDRDIYHIPVRGSLEVRFENLSQVAWAPYGGLAEKSSYCHPSSCTVAPGGTLTVTPSDFSPGMVVEIWLAPYPALDYHVGFPVILDLEAAP